MNFDFAEQINPYLEKLDFEKAISIGETELQKIPIFKLKDLKHCRWLLKQQNSTFTRELNDLLFSYPYIKIGVLEERAIAKRQTASQYLQRIAKSGWLHSFKIGRDVYYINHKLIEILSQ